MLSIRRTNIDTCKSDEKKNCKKVSQTMRKSVRTITGSHIQRSTYAIRHIHKFKKILSRSRREKFFAAIPFCPFFCRFSVHSVVRDERHFGGAHTQHARRSVVTQPFSAYLFAFTGVLHFRFEVVEWRGTQVQD